MDIIVESDGIEDLSDRFEEGKESKWRRSHEEVDVGIHTRNKNLNYQRGRLRDGSSNGSPTEMTNECKLSSNC